MEDRPTKDLVVCEGVDGKARFQGELEGFLDLLVLNEVGEGSERDGTDDLRLWASDKVERVA